MLILGIDSSDDFLSVGIADQSGIVLSRGSGSEARNKNMLHALIENIISESKVGFEDLSGVAVAIGPGSFTGLRVGLAAAKGICWSMRLPLMGVSSLMAVARATDIADKKMLAVKDAKRQEFYYAGFFMEGTELQQLLPDSVGSANGIRELIEKDFLPVGPGVDELKKYMPDLAGISNRFRPEMTGGAVAAIGLGLLSKGETLDIETAAPNYIRAPKPMEWN